MCVCVCRNICTYNWNGLPLKNNNKKKGHVEAMHTRWPRIDLKIQSNLKLFETRFLIHTCMYIYIFIGFERNFIAYVSSTNLSTSNSFYFIISPEIVDLTTLEIAIVISI